MKHIKPKILLSSSALLLGFAGVAAADSKGALIAQQTDLASDKLLREYQSEGNGLHDDEHSTDLQRMRIDERATAEGILGATLYNQREEPVATIEDIILSNNGEALMVVVRDGDFIGLGKQAAFDYDIVTSQTESGDMVATITESAIDQAAEFSFERNADSQAEGENIRTMPQNGYRVSELLDAEFVSDRGEDIGDVENILFRNGKADRLVVGYGEILGMGGEEATLSFGDAEIITHEEDLAFRLSAQESADFEAFKETETR